MESSSNNTSSTTVGAAEWTPQSDSTIESNRTHEGEEMHGNRNLMDNMVEEEDEDGGSDNFIDARGSSFEDELNQNAIYDGLEYLKTVEGSHNTAFKMLEDDLDLMEYKARKTIKELRDSNILI